MKKGTHHSEETKQKMLQVMKGRIFGYKFQKGKKNPKWKGGKTKDPQGYWYIYKPEHPRAHYSKGIYIKQAVLIAEKYLDRFLKKGECVHHINGIKDDDRPENLYLFSSNFEHIKFENLKNKPRLKSNLIK